MELRRAIKLAENPGTVDQAICYLNRVIDDSRRTGRFQATVPQAMFLRSAMHLQGQTFRISSVSLLYAGNRFKLPDRGGAFADLCSAIAIEPNYAAVPSIPIDELTSCQAWLNRAGMHFEDGRYEEALSDVETAIQVFHAPRSSWPAAKHSVTCIQRGGMRERCR